MEHSFWLQAEDNCELYVKSWGKEMKDAKAVIQVAHGMVEHIGRYQDFAKFLNEQGFIVYGNDHRGHGKTGDKQGLLGYFADESGFDLTVEDMYMLTKHIESEHPQLPIFIFGHSMGSFITRNYLQKYSHKPTGVILSGSGSFPRITATIGKRIASNLPPLQQSAFMNKLVFGNYNNKIKKKLTAYDWLTRDEKIVKDYTNDPHSGYIPTAGFFTDLLTGILAMQEKDNNLQVRKDIPMLFISGDQDPVGNYGKGVFRAATTYQEAGLENVAVMLFPGARHELHNEINKDEVLAGIVAWVEQELEGQV